MAAKHDLPKLKRKLWKVFTLYIKERDEWTCFTCGKIATGWGMGGGHFIPKSTGGLALYFHEDNVHAQCARCNLLLQGNQYEYGLRLGKRRVNALNKLRGAITKWDETTYIVKIEHYKKLYKNLCKRKSLEK